MMLWFGQGSPGELSNLIWSFLFQEAPCSGIAGSLLSLLDTILAHSGSKGIECHRTNMNQHCYKHKNLEFPDPQHEHWVFGKVWHGRPFTVQRTKLWHFCEACPVIIGSYWIHRAPDGPRWTTIHWQWASNWRSLKLRVSTCGLLAKCWDILMFPGDWWNCPAHYPGGPVWREEFKDLDEDTAVIQVRWFRCTKIWMMINYDDWLRYPNFKHVWFSTVRCWGMPKCRIARSFQICGLGLGKRAKRAAVFGVW